MEDRAAPRIWVVNYSGHDLRSALEHTTLPEKEAFVMLTEGNVDVFRIDRAAYNLAAMLVDFKPGDLLLLSGYTVLNVLAAMIVNVMHAQVDVLLYHRKEERYWKRTIREEQLRRCIEHGAGESQTSRRDDSLG